MSVTLSKNNTFHRVRDCFIKRILVIATIASLSQTSHAYAETTAETTLTEQIEHTENVVGKAYDKDRQLLYTEQHFYFDDNTHQVKYFDANGTLVAEKQLDYRDSAIRPALEQTNFLLGKTNKVKYQNYFGKKNTIAITTLNNGVIDYQKEITITDDTTQKLVIDAGFNKFIQLHWQDLIDGNSKTMDFLLLNSGRTVNLRIVKSKPNNTAKNDPCDSNNICFKITASNFVFRTLSSPIFLQYNKNNKSLLQFKGRSNLANEKGNYPEVTIDYNYPNPNEPNPDQPNTHQ